MTIGMNKAVARLYLAVGSGAGIGSVLRFVVGYGTVQLGLAAFWGTVLVNIAGSFIIGVFSTLTGPEGRVLISPVWRQFVMAGLCGGLTTFSAMSLETFLMLIHTGPAYAAFYIVALVAASLAAAWSGFALAVRLNR